MKKIIFVFGIAFIFTMMFSACGNYFYDNDDNTNYGWEETEEEIVQKWRLEHITPEMEIAECKAKLFKTDYKAIKRAEGWYTEEEYAPIKLAREVLRERIRELENVADN